MGTLRTSRRVAAAVTALFLLSPVTAVAGPDDGKAVVTRTHVDAPKTFWSGDTFRLKSSYEGDKVKDVEDTVVWVGKGWAWGGTGDNQYQFEVPADPALSFLGDPGDIVYAAPNNPNGGNEPIWLGFGADDLPTEKFRDGTVSLDLVSVNGPGRVDKFIKQRSNSPIEYLLSSADGPRSYFLWPGAHTHNYTTFTRPGRYEVTYRTVARDLEGNIVSSKLTTMPIQVGGQRPLDQKTPTTSERYDKAPVGDLDAAGYTLSVAPYEGGEQDGDENLSTLTFTAEDSTLKGTLTLFINGYFLTDLDVTDGTATWNELLGAESSDIQAVFTPEGETGARWISPALSYAKGKPNTVTSEQGNAELAAPVNDPANTVLDDALHTPTNLNYTAKVEPLSGTRSKLTVDFEDKNFRGFMRGGLYEPDVDTEDSELASLFIYGAVENGHLELEFDSLGVFDGYLLRADLLPHPTVNAPTGVLALHEPFSHSATQNTAGALSADNPEPDPGDGQDDSPNPGQSNTLSSGSSVDLYGVIGVTMAAVFGIAVVSFFAQHAPALAAWFNRTIGR